MTTQNQNAPDLIDRDEQPVSPAAANRILATLFIGTFAVGCAEMLVIGVLDVLARSMSVSVPAAGALVTASAFGLGVGGPALTALTIRVDRRTILIASLAGFILVTAIPVALANYDLFLACRVVAGAVQGLFIAAAFTIGPSVMAPELTGRAISVVLSGFAVSAAAGVPIGAVIGDQIGWRGAFGVVLVLASMVLVVACLVIPSTPGVSDSVSGQARSAFAPRVLALLAVFFLVFTANSTLVTYLIPFLSDVAGVSGPVASLFLFAYGAATLAGSIYGGRLANARAAALTLIGGSVGLCAALLAMDAVGSVAVVVAPVLVGLGLCAFGITPAAQFRIVSLAGPGGTLAASLPASAANAGIAAGSLVGGAAIDLADVRAVTLVGAAIAAAAAVVAVLTRSLRAPADPAMHQETTATREGAS